MSMVTANIAEFLQQNPSVSGREAARRLGVPESTLRGVKAKMQSVQKSTVQEVEIKELVLDPSTQPRSEMDSETIQEYTDAIVRLVKFPPIDVFDDGTTKRVADGFHRVAAAVAAGLETIQANVFEGGERDAILYSLSVNATHGLPRRNADKRRVVETILRDKEWSDQFRTDTAIALHCGVSSNFVGHVRKTLSNNGVAVAEAKRTHNDSGKVSKRQAVEKMLRDAETAALGESIIANMCDVSVPFVSRVYRELGLETPSKKAKKADKSIHAGASEKVNDSNSATHRRREAGDDDEDIPVNGYLAEDVEGEVNPTTPEPSEEERFLQSLPLSSVLPGRSLQTFHREALRFRRARAAIDTLKSLGLSAEPKAGEVLGPFTWLVIKLVRFSWPNGWGKCLTCEGRGDGGCRTCFGSGFVAK